MTPINGRAGMFSGNTRFQACGLTVLRIAVGVIFLAHGYLKFHKMGMGGTIGFFTHIGVPLPTLAAWFSVLAETLGALALILGVFTPIAGAALAIDMAGAIIFAKGLHSGLLAPKGYELELALLAASVALALSGPGALALGNLIGRRRLTS